jgi:hypothetical protein
MHTQIMKNNEKTPMRIESLDWIASKVGSPITAHEKMVSMTRMGIIASSERTAEWRSMRTRTFASLLGASVTVPLQDGGMVLGARQNLYLVESDGPQLRDLAVQVMGE